MPQHFWFTADAGGGKSTLATWLAEHLPATRLTVRRRATMASALLDKDGPPIIILDLDEMDPSQMAQELRQILACKDRNAVIRIGDHRVRSKMLSADKYLLLFSTTPPSLIHMSALTRLGVHFVSMRPTQAPTKDPVWTLEAEPQAEVPEILDTLTEQAEKLVNHGRRATDVITSMEALIALVAINSSQPKAEAKKLWLERMSATFDFLIAHVGQSEGSR